MAIPARLSLVTLGVDDLARSVAFYEALGWPRCESSNDEIAWFKVAGSYVGVFGRASLAEDAHLPNEPRAPFGGITLAINVETEREVQGCLDAAVAAGGSLLKAPERADWGGFSGYFADPDGHPWEIARNPFFPLDDEGRIEIPSSAPTPNSAVARATPSPSTGSVPRVQRADPMTGAARRRERR